MSYLILTVGVILLAMFAMILAVWRIALYFSTASDEYDADDAPVEEMNIQTPSLQYARGYVFSEVPHNDTTEPK